MRNILFASVALIGLAGQIQAADIYFNTSHGWRLNFDEEESWCGMTAPGPVHIGAVYNPLYPSEEILFMVKRGQARDTSYRSTLTFFNQEGGDDQYKTFNVIWTADYIPEDNVTWFETSFYIEDIQYRTRISETLRVSIPALSIDDTINLTGSLTALNAMALCIDVLREPNGVEVEGLEQRRRPALRDMFQ